MTEQARQTFLTGLSDLHFAERSAAGQCHLVPDFDAAEIAVRDGVDSSCVAIVGPHDPGSARAAARRGCAEARGPLPPAPHVPPWRTLVVIPTYNERENLEALVRAVHDYLACDVLIVDDGSPDGTGELADRLAAADQRIRVLHRQGKFGLGTAYLAGFRQALADGYERICEMDADFSHAPWDLPRLVHASRDVDLVIGSRYVRGGRTIGWPLRRRLLSRAANCYARTVLGTGIRDNTAGFRCFRADALRRIDLDRIDARGYAFQIEMAYRLVRDGARVREIPIRFVDRRLGRSKMDAGIAREALWLVPRLRLRGRKRSAG